MDFNFLQASKTTVILIVAISVKQQIIAIQDPCPVRINQTIIPVAIKLQLLEDGARAKKKCQLLLPRAITSCDHSERSRTASCELNDSGHNIVKSEYMFVHLFPTHEQPYLHQGR